MSVDTSDEAFRARFAQLISDLLNETRRDDEPISVAIQAHLGSDGAQLQIHGEELPSFELANLQLGLDAALARPGYSHTVLGVAGQGRRFSEVSLTDLLRSSHHRVGPPEYVSAPAGPSRTLPCLTWSVVLITAPDGPVCLFIRRGEEFGPVHGIVVQAISAKPETAVRFLADLRRLMDEHDVFRGQVISISADNRGSLRVHFLERPELDEGDLILPDGLLERIERHALGPTNHRDALLARNRHLSRGLLLWGPPGTGKTHTVRYLTGRLRGSTVIILSGASLGAIGRIGGIARRLAPAVVVLEDVDLIAQERTFGPQRSQPALFELMNEMSGLAEDADVAFILTTNRPDALEPALAARPGRVDLAIEIPLPDATARRRLLELYARGLDLEPSLGEIADRTAGATASFFRELLRKATLASIEAGHERVTESELTNALDELLAETAALTRVLLGHADGGKPEAGTPHAWMERMAQTPSAE